MIPPVLFQTWKSKTDLPPTFAYWSGTFRTHNPDFRFELWDDGDNRAFIADRFPWFLPTYDAYPAEIFRADAVRYFWLYDFGGVYADMDTECLRPLAPLLELAPVQLGRMGGDPAFSNGLPNAVMLSAPRQAFWLLVISLMLSARRGGPEAVTGSMVLRAAHQLWTDPEQAAEAQARAADVRARLGPGQQPSDPPGEVRAHPPHMLFPLDWTDRVHGRFVREPLIARRQVLDPESARELFPRAYTVSYWVHSWEPLPHTPEGLPQPPP